MRFELEEPEIARAISLFVLHQHPTIPDTATLSVTMQFDEDNGITAIVESIDNENQQRSDN